MDVQRWEFTWAALGRKAVLVPSAAVTLLRAAATLLVLLGKHREVGSCCALSSKVSFHRDTIVSGG